MATDPHPPAQGREDDVALQVLARGDLTVRGRLVEASNATLVATATLDGVDLDCVYKPVAGERPLWDFPSRTLARREVASYLLSVAGGWGVVPPTVLREGPFGPGSVQRWVDEVPGEGGSQAEPGAGLVDVVAPGAVPAGWFTVIQAEGMDGRPLALVHADDDDLRRMAVFDIVANNADRKGGHVLRDVSGAVLGVDHGLTFNVDPKLRTVLWGWAGRPLDAALLAGVERVSADLAGESGLWRALSRLLSGDEVDQTRHRADRLASTGRFPRPGRGRPSIPWPAF